MAELSRPPFSIKGLEGALVFIVSAVVSGYNIFGYFMEVELHPGQICMFTELKSASSLDAYIKEQVLEVIHRNSSLELATTTCCHKILGIFENCGCRICILMCLIHNHTVIDCHCYLGSKTKDQDN